MAKINDPNIAANLAQVGMGSGTVWTPQHVTPGPLSVGTGGAYRLGLRSAIMAASLGADAELYQFRFVTAASRVCLVHGVSISASVVTLPAVSTTVYPGPFHVRLGVARAWSAAGSGGTRGVLTTNNSKLRTAHATSEVNDAGISSTAALTAGTKTLDTSDLSTITTTPMGVLTAVGVGSPIPLIVKQNMLGEFAGSLAFPLVLANQEGFIIRNGAVAFPATMTWSFSVDVIWSEVQSF